LPARLDESAEPTGAAVPFVLAAIAGVEAPVVTVTPGGAVTTAVAVGRLGGAVGLPTGTAVPFVPAALAGVDAPLVAAGFGVSVAFDPPHAARTAAAALAAIPFRKIRRDRRCSMIVAPYSSHYYIIVQRHRIHDARMKR